MRTPALKSDSISYAKRLFEASVDGAVAAWKGSGYRAFTPAPSRAVLAPAAVGATLGILGVCANRTRRRSGFSMAIGGLIGSAIGFGAGIACTGTAARSVMKRVNAVRDAHWLEKHPIAYA